MNFIFFFHLFFYKGRHGAPAAEQQPARQPQLRRVHELRAARMAAPHQRIYISAISAEAKAAVEDY
eukprot:5781980-Pyramimonas_sp.AAC.1